MADKTKLMLSDVELRFVKDTGWVLTKHKIIGVVYQLLNEQVPVIRQAFREVSEETKQRFSSSIPRISKGENYQSLPYVILDYPAVFGKENIFALRTMFWWGKFISITLQLSGTHADDLRQRIIENIREDSRGLFICISDSQWDHHWEADNYIPVSAIPVAEAENILHSKPFVKLALKFELEDWNDLPALLERGYGQICRIIAG